MQTYSFLVDLAGTVLAIAFLVFSFIYVHNDLKKKRDVLHFFCFVFLFCSANDPKNRQGHKFRIRPDPYSFKASSE